MPYLNLKNSKKHISRLFCIIILVPIILTPASYADDGVKSSSSLHNSPILKNEVLPATGKQETILTISKFGRYSVLAKSAQGSSLQLVDRMAGPGLAKGIIGKEDGRLDLFLDRGDYKIISRSHKKGEGEVSLKSYDFRELNSPRPPRLIEHKIIETTLNDFQQRSYWIEIKKRRFINIEAAGRNLSDMRLWKDGNWLIDISPAEEVLEPVNGKPLGCQRIVADLQPGLYLLTTYGGPTKAWAKTSEDHPLYIRFGIPQLAEAGRRRFTASPFGIDRWIVPGSANFFRLELEKAEPATMKLVNYNESDPYNESGIDTHISKKSLPPATEISTSRRNKGFHLVSIKREAGKPYILQHFKSIQSHRFSATGKYWISSIHSGHGEDSVDATALLTEIPYRGREKLIRSSTIKLDGNRPWGRRFNLLQALTLYLEVTQGGEYTVGGQGAKARFKVEPLLTYRPQNYESPDFKASGQSWRLDPGFYVLTAEPIKKDKGILDLKIHPARSSFYNSVLNLKTQAEKLFSSEAGAPSKDQSVANTAVRFSPVQLNSRSNYILYLNKQPGVKSGIILRKLPVDLATPLAVTQKGKEALMVQVKIPEEGEIVAIAESGLELPLSINKGKKEKRHRIKAGIYTIGIQNVFKGALNYSLIFTPKRFFSDTPLPPLDDNVLARIPTFPVLSADNPKYFDVRKKQAKTFNVKVDMPGLYRLETNGLLQTAGNFRTRTIPSLFNHSNNGVGRNFLIQQYMGQGDYQLTVAPEGNTRGHLGLELSKTTLNDGGILKDGKPARFSLPAGEGLLYKFNIGEEGQYNLKSLGLNRNFRIRLEDSEGWPVIRPGHVANLSRELAPGSYKLVVLPQPVEARIVTILNKVPEKTIRKGHGAHDIALNERVRHQWIEPEEDKERLPDEWLFAIPASVDVNIDLSDEMGAELFHFDASSKSKQISIFTGREKWRGILKAGQYSLKIKSIRPNNLFDYSLRVSANDLMAGQKRSIQIPAELTVAVGSSELIELSSFGDKDVRARLYDDSGVLLAQNDDRPDDWNFHIVKKLDKGKYRLLVEPVGTASASTTVSMFLPDEVRESSLSLPAKLRIKDTSLHYFPLELNGKDNILLFTTNSTDSTAIAVERMKSGKWITIGSSTGKNPRLAIVLKNNKERRGSKYRLRVGSIDRRNGNISLQAMSLTTPSVPEQQFTGRGITLIPIDGVSPPLGITSVKLDSPGLFKVKRQSNTLLWATERGQQLKAGTDGFIAGNKEAIWLIDELSDKVQTILRADRMSLKEGKDLQCTISGEKPIVINSASEKDQLHLIFVEAKIGQPGIAIIGEKDNADKNVNKTGVRNRSAITVGRGSEIRAISLWDAGNHSNPFSVTLRQYGFKKPVEEKIGWGLKDASLKGKIARRYGLPSGHKQIRLTLPESTAAVISKGDDVIKTIWSGSQNSVEVIDSQADTLLLFHTVENDATAGFEVISSDPDQLSGNIENGALLKRYFSSNGYLHLDFRERGNTKDRLLKLHIFGEDSEATIIERKGEIKRGKSLTIEEGANIAIKHGPGLLLALISNDAYDIGQTERYTHVTRVDPPETVTLKGEATVMKFNRDKASMLSMKSNVPVIAHISTGTAAPRIELFPQGANLNIYLPEGLSTVTLYSATSERMSGLAEVVTTDMMSVEEGLGPPVMLPPGATRLFTFDITREGSVGIGVKASADMVNCRLLDESGHVIGNGVVQMHRLTPGKYIMAVDSPPDGIPVEIQAAVVGTKPPATGPPDKIIRKYLDLAGLKGKGKE
ncbi:MAG: hypothetical protein IME96_00415 [Proteobacteria bacterium]|nr:hypothetical protein [Pseudomonadota bacterium]